MTQSDGDLADQLVTASRALVAITTRALVRGAVDLTLVQYRCLVVLAFAGDTPTTALAQEVGVHQSTRHACLGPAGAQGAGAQGQGRGRPPAAP